MNRNSTEVILLIRKQKTGIARFFKALFYLFLAGAPFYIPIFRNWFTFPPSQLNYRILKKILDSPQEVKWEVHTKRASDAGSTRKLLIVSPLATLALTCVPWATPG